MIKRLLDILAAGFGLVVLSPALMLVAVLVKCGSRGPILFRHERVGRGFRPLQVLKFRTMVENAAQIGGPITFGDDPRVTRVGRLLRKSKLDELPQLLNVLAGDMSLVGPRPEVRRYVEMFRDDYEEILRVRPGITDLASIKFRDEAAILGAAADPEAEYVGRVLPEKIRLARQYVRERSFRLDLAIICGTLIRLLHDRVPNRRGGPAVTSADGNATTCAGGMSQLYSGPKFQAWSSSRPRLMPYEARLIETHCPQTDVPVLVVGSGNGRETFGMYDAGFHDIRGVDITPALVELANQRSRQLQLGVEFVLASAERLPFADGSFSLLTMFENVYGHITPRAARLAVLTEARRVLKPGGLLFVEVTNLHDTYRHRAYIEVMNILHVVRNPCQLGPGDKVVSEARQLQMPSPLLPRTHWFLPHEVDAEAEEASFEIVQATTRKGIIADSAADARTYHNQGRLLYVLRKPINPSPCCESAPH